MALVKVFAQGSEVGRCDEYPISSIKIVSHLKFSSIKQKNLGYDLYVTVSKKIISKYRRNKMAIRNNVRLIGRLTKEPEARGNEAAKYTLAIEKEYKPAEGEATADFVDCICFKKRADYALRYLHKGDLVAMEGRIFNQKSYTNKEGNKVYPGLGVIVDSHSRLSYRKTDDSSAADGSNMIPDSDGFMSLDGIDEPLPY